MTQNNLEGISDEPKDLSRREFFEGLRYGATLSIPIGLGMGVALNYAPSVFQKIETAMKEDAFPKYRKLNDRILLGMAHRDSVPIGIPVEIEFMISPTISGEEYPNRSLYKELDGMILPKEYLTICSSDGMPEENCRGEIRSRHKTEVTFTSYYGDPQTFKEARMEAVLAASSKKKVTVKGVLGETRITDKGYLASSIAGESLRIQGSDRVFYLADRILFDQAEIIRKLT